MNKMEMNNNTACKHEIAHWRGMPYDWDKGGAYYRLYCFECGEDLLSETFLPGNLDPFSIERIGWKLGLMNTGDSSKTK